jgi:acetyl esterase/lipase
VKGVSDVCQSFNSAILKIDYRLAPETKLDAILEDIDAAYGWLRKEGSREGLDADRVAVVGHSAGGYLTLMAGCRFSPKPAALVSFYGYGDIAGDWYSRPDPYYLSVFREEIEFLHAKLGRHNSSLRVLKRGKGEL